MHNSNNWLSTPNWDIVFEHSLIVFTSYRWLFVDCSSVWLRRLHAGVHSGGNSAEHWAL